MAVLGLHHRAFSKRSLWKFLNNSKSWNGCSCCLLSWEQPRFEESFSCVHACSAPAREAPLTKSADSADREECPITLPGRSRDRNPGNRDGKTSHRPEPVKKGELRVFESAKRMMFLRGQAGKRTLEMKMIFKKKNGIGGKKDERAGKNEEINSSEVWGCKTFSLAKHFALQDVFTATHGNRNLS